MHESTGISSREFLKAILLVRALTFFHFNVFLKIVLYALYVVHTGQYVVQSKKSILTTWSWDKNHL